MSILDRFHRRRVAANPLEAAAAPEVDTARPASAPAEPASPPASDTVVRRRALGRLQVGIAALLCLVNGAVSGLLLLQHHGEERAAAAVSQVCGEGADRSGCEIVARSRYSTVAGVPLAAIGLFFYLALAALLALSLLGGAESRDAAAWLALVALMLAMGTDLALLAVQMVAIRAFCRLCLATYVVNLLALVVLIPARRDTRVIKEAVRRPDGRVALAGSLLIALALGAAVTAAEVGLSYRERERASAVLGSLPPPLPSPSLPSTLSSPAIPGSDVQRYQEEARVATEQARRLQEILDDPHKLEQYFTEKAAREYEQGPVYKLKLEGVPMKGPASAPIRVVDYSDFLCPFCRQIAGAFSQFLPSAAGRVALYYKNYPLDSECNPHMDKRLHPGACVVAKGGLCAHEQGKFWQYHDRVFATELKEPQLGDVARLASEAGLDAGALQTCVGSAATQSRLAAEIEEGWNSGVRGTPTLFINGKRLPRINDFVQTVDKEAAKLGLPPLPKAQ